jgi:hypothetical protein
MFTDILIVANPRSSVAISNALSGAPQHFRLLIAGSEREMRQLLTEADPVAVLLDDAAPVDETIADEDIADEDIAEADDDPLERLIALRRRTLAAPSCPSCGDPFDPEDHFCRSCGTDLSEVRSR